MKIIESKDRLALESLKQRKIDFNAVVEKMQPVVNAVKTGGDAAIKRFVKQFDNKVVQQIRISKQSAYQVDSNLEESLQIAKDNIMKFHSSQMPNEWSIEVSPGIRAGQLVRPINKVGCYIPGGRYPLISTVLMTVLPARIAGVKEVVVCTPNPCPEILFACELCGVDQIFEVGGPMAIAAMAYGTETVPKVDKIVGPGNVYVTAAKKIVYGDVGIDFIAGPSEVVIIANEESDPNYIAADMLAQAEHDVVSMALCLTPSRQLASKVIEAIEQRIQNLPTKQTARLSLESRSAIIIVESIEEAFAISNDLAPEHLEIQIEDESLLRLVENAGSVFLGKYAPEAAGDYASGPNHVLPTGGFAAAQSGLSVRDFIKTPTVQRLTEEGLKSIAPVIITLAKAEGLEAHADSIKVRLQ